MIGDNIHPAVINDGDLKARSRKPVADKVFPKVPNDPRVAGTLVDADHHVLRDSVAAGTSDVNVPKVTKIGHA